MMDMTTRTFFCGDLFTQGGSGERGAHGIRHPRPQRSVPRAHGLLRARAADHGHPRTARARAADDAGLHAWQRLARGRGEAAARARRIAGRRPGTNSRRKRGQAPFSRNRCLAPFFPRRLPRCGLQDAFNQGDPHGPLPEHSRNHRQHAGGQAQQARSARRQRLRQGGIVQPDGFGQGPHGARHHRRRRAQRRVETRPDRHRSHQRQHRHRPCDGVRAEGLSTGGHHGREFQRRAPQAAALSRREGGADARVREGQRHARESRRARDDARLVPVPAVREPGECGCALAHHGARDHQRLRRSAARLLRDRLRHGRHAERRGARTEALAAGHAHRRRGA